jgi:hypothetical protein
VLTRECKEFAHCNGSSTCDLLNINIDRGVMLNDGKLKSQLMASPFTILLGLLPSKSTLHHNSCSYYSSSLPPII